MAAITVIIVATDRRGTAHAGIEYLIDNANQAWRVEDAIRFHDVGLYRFVTGLGLVQTPIQPRSNGTSRWMQTVSNGIPTDNLLSLPIRNVAA